MQIGIEITEKLLVIMVLKKKALWKNTNMKFSSLFTWESVK